MVAQNLPILGRRSEPSCVDMSGSVLFRVQIVGNSSAAMGAAFPKKKRLKQNAE